MTDERRQIQKQKITECANQNNMAELIHCFPRAENGPFRDEEFILRKLSINAVYHNQIVYGANKKIELSFF